MPPTKAHFNGEGAFSFPLSGCLSKNFVTKGGEVGVSVSYGLISSFYSFKERKC